MSPSLSPSSPPSLLPPPSQTAAFVAVPLSPSLSLSLSSSSGGGGVARLRHHPVSLPYHHPGATGGRINHSVVVAPLSSSLSSTSHIHPCLSTSFLHRHHTRHQQQHPPFHPRTLAPFSCTLQQQQQQQQTSSSSQQQQKLPAVVFVLGGPCSGKGTQCALLTKKYNMSQLCVGDLLRHEASSGSSLGSEISDLMQHGKIVPGEITMRLLHQALQTLASTSSSSSSIVLIDGFPRAMDQALQFEQSVTAPEFVLFFDCADEQLTTRMRARRAKSGKLGKGKVRDDDVESVFVKRLQTFRETTMPVVGYYKERNKVKMIDAGENQTPESVFQQTRPLFEQLLREIDDDDDEQEDEQLQEKQEEEDSQEQGQTAEQTV